MKHLTDGDRDTLREQERDARDGTGIVDCPGDLFDVGFGHGLTGETVGAMMTTVRRELGALSPVLVDALLAGHACGIADAEAYRRDMESRADVVAADEPYPF